LCVTAFFCVGLGAACVACDLVGVAAGVWASVDTGVGVTVTVTVLVTVLVACGRGFSLTATAERMP